MCQIHYSLTTILLPAFMFFFFFTATATPEIYTLSLHDALPIFYQVNAFNRFEACRFGLRGAIVDPFERSKRTIGEDILSAVDRKSTRLNSSHPSISYAVFCLKKKNKARSACQITCDRPTTTVHP